MDGRLREDASLRRIGRITLAVAVFDVISVKNDTKRQMMDPKNDLHSLKSQQIAAGSAK